MTKKQRKVWTAAVSVAVVAASLSPAVQAAQLKDIGSYRYATDIKALVSQGIIAGYADGTFKPNRTVSRADVVRLLGRYLVSLGYEVPANYKGNIAFSDLSSKTDDELLQYAALVKEQGVFYGDGNRLMPNRTLTREQAAMVLVRAFSKIDSFDYATHVNGQLFVKEYLDVEQTMETARKAIDVFDYYDIVTDSMYYPENGTTRGQFASMMYRIMQLNQSNSLTDFAIQDVTVISPLRLKATLSNGSVQDVMLTEPLIENVPTRVTFQVNGQTFTRTVTYKIEQLKVLDVEGINSGQFVIRFNQEVDLATTYREGDIAKILSLTPNSTESDVTFQKGELGEDKKSFIVTIDSKSALRGSYRLKMAGVHAVNGTAMPEYDESVYFATDSTTPRVEKIEALKDNKVKVKFTEPLYSNNGTISYTNSSGGTVTGIEATYNDNTWNSYENSTEIIFDLSDARSNYGKLGEYSTVNVKMTDVRDIAGNSTTLNFTIRKEGADSQAPRLLSVTQVGAKSFKMTFSEPMERMYSYQVLLQSNNFEYYVEEVERVEDDDASFIVKVNDYLEGFVQISSNSRYLVKDVTGQSGTFSVTYPFNYDTSKARVERTEVIRENNLQYLYVHFDRNVEMTSTAKVAMSGSYELNGATYTLYNTKKATVFPVSGQKNTLRIPLDELVANNDRDGAVYNVQLLFEGVTSEYNELVDNSFVTFKRTKDYNYTDEKLEIVAVHTSRTDKTITNNNLVVLEFNYPVNETMARDLYYYELEGYSLRSATVSPSAPNKVELLINGTIANQDDPYLYVESLRGKSIVEPMDTYYERIYLNENVAPTYSSASFINKREMKLTFSEAIAPIDSKAFYVTNNKGESLNAIATNDPANSRNVIVTLSEDVPKYSDVTVQLLSNREYKDVYQNKGSFTSISVTNNSY